MPSSFDSEGISHAARYGPVAASMPSKFGELSSPVQRAGPSDSVKALREIAYGPDLRKVPAAIGSSPPSGLAAADIDSSGPRFLHSQQRPVKPRILSASVPRLATLADDWEDNNFPMEEDYLPTNLHDDVLTPQERLRRISRSDPNDVGVVSPSSHGGLGMTSGGSGFSGKVGSPLGSSPSSRFGALFAKQRQKKEEESSSAQNIAAPPIGSPLRESSSYLPIGSSRAAGDMSPFVSSPTRQSSVSVMTQQLGAISLHPGFTRQTMTRFDRAISSPVSTSRIDEEQSDMVFSMEEEENNKRNSASWAGTDRASSNGEEGTPTSMSFRP